MSLKREVVMSLCCLVSLHGCMNPTASIRPDVDLFKSDPANHLEALQTSQRTIRIASSGNPNSQTLVFIHGSPGSWEGWAHFLVDEKLKLKYHLFAVDRPGYGGSEKGKTEVSIEAQATAIVEAVKQRSTSRAVIVVGHSYGGPLAAKIAMLYPEFVSGLVLVAASVSPDLEQTMWYQNVATWWPFRSLIPTDLRVCNEEIMPLKQQLTEMLPGWEKLETPTAILQGEADSLVPPANVDFLLQHLPAKSIVQVTRVPDLNHFIPWKRPDLITEAIEQVVRAQR